MVGRLAGIKYAFAKPMGGPDRPPPALTSRGGRLMVRSPVTTRCRDRVARQDPRRADLAAGHGSTRRRGSGRSTTDRDGTRLRERGRGLSAIAAGAVGRLRARWTSSPGSGLARSNRSDRIRTNELSAYRKAIELGLNAALPPVYELKASIAEFGRGERIRAEAFQLSYEIDAAGSSALANVG